MYLSNACSKVWIRYNLSDPFPNETCRYTSSFYSWKSGEFKLIMRQTETTMFGSSWLQLIRWTHRRQSKATKPWETSEGRWSRGTFTHSSAGRGSTVIPCRPNAKKNHSTKTVYTSCENVAKSKYFYNRVTDQNYIQEGDKSSLWSRNVCDQWVQNLLFI